MFRMNADPYLFCYYELLILNFFSEDLYGLSNIVDCSSFAYYCALIL